MPYVPDASLFPRLSTVGFDETSLADVKYNCVGWAMGVSHRWWWPSGDDHWPSGVALEETLAAFTEAFATEGYSPCDNGELEPQVEKVALFALNGVPTHAARQLANGKWTSKLGEDPDIEHPLAAVGGGYYGEVLAFFRRPRVA